MNPKWVGIMALLSIITLLVLIASPAHVWIPLVIMGVFVLYSLL